MYELSLIHTSDAMCAELKIRSGNEVVQGPRTYQMEVDWPANLIN